jgi:hypothetical protein
MPNHHKNSIEKCRSDIDTGGESMMFREERCKDLISHNYNPQIRAVCKSGTGAGAGEISLNLPLRHHFCNVNILTAA